MPRQKLPPGALNTARAAAYLGISESYLSKMRCYPSMQGPVHAKIGSRVVYRVRDLDDWLDGRMTGPARPRAPKPSTASAARPRAARPPKGAR